MPLGAKRDAISSKAIDDYWVNYSIKKGSASITDTTPCQLQTIQCMNL